MLVDDDPITFHDGAKDPAGPRNDALGDQIKALHSGDSLDARWITLHNTATDGTAAFDANALAKAKGATPLKRPENGSFVPGTGFKSFVFVETGDTNKDAGNYAGAAERGAWGAILRVDMPFAGSNNADGRDDRARRPDAQLVRQHELPRRGDAARRRGPGRRRCTSSSTPWTRCGPTTSPSRWRRSTAQPSA